MTENKPGVMIYFELLPAVQRMSDVARGQLFLAILSYAKDGIEPVLDDNLMVIWAFMKPRIDADDAAYLSKQLHSKHAAYCKQHGKIDFDTWLATVCDRKQAVTGGNDRERAVTGGNGRYPTTESTSAPPSSSSAGASANTPAARAQEPAALPPPSPSSENGFVPPTVRQVADYCRENGLHVDAQRFADYYASRGWMQGNTPIRAWEPLARNWAATEYAKPRNAPPQPVGTRQLDEDEIAAIRRSLEEPEPLDDFPD